MDRDDKGRWILPAYWADPELPRPPLPKAGKPCKDEVFYRKWATDHAGRCMACLIPDAKMPFPGPSVHHIAKNCRRHEATNLIRLCDRCHRLAENNTVVGQLNGEKAVWGPLRLEHVLWLKLVEDGGSLDLLRLSAVLGRYVPTPECPAGHLILRERRDRRYLRGVWSLAWDRPGETWDGKVRHLNCPLSLEGQPEWSPDREVV